MTASKSPVALFGAVALTLALLTGCERQPEAVPVPAPEAGDSSQAAIDYANSLRDKVSVDAMMGHLRSLQDIADANNGTRAAGTPGYDASVDYVAKLLQDNGFDVQTPSFEFKVFQAEAPRFSVAGRQIEARALEYTIGTSSDVVANLVAAPAEDSPGCTASDYDGLNVAGAIVLVDRGECTFTEKVAAATERGAAALVVADNVDEPSSQGTLGEDADVRIPVVAISKADGALLRAEPGAATLGLDARTESIQTRSVIAQTKTGATDSIVMVGAHLDSVPEGPGINDNGSGVATLLETALQMGSSPDISYAVRFGFWGAEEPGLLGSANYVQSLDEDALKDIALYMNYDMVGSPNPGYFTYDGDQSTAPGDSDGTPRVPEGSAGIERTLVGYLDAAGKPARDTSFNGRSDYDAFTQAGVPAGGLFSGAEEKMTSEEAQLWGGQAGEPYDPNYHKAGDTFDHIDQTAMGILGGGAAWAVGLYAQDQGGRNGLPTRDIRTRHVVTKS